MMHPDPPKKEEELAEYVEMWQDKMRGLEAHGDEFKWAPVFKINALRMLMTGKVKEYFDIWEASEVKDYARRRKLDSSGMEKLQHGGDPMDVGVVGGWSW